jgi:hypothetical protein
MPPESRASKEVRRVLLDDVRAQDKCHFRLTRKIRNQLFLGNDFFNNHDMRGHTRTSADVNVQAKVITSEARDLLFWFLRERRRVSAHV